MHLLDVKHACKPKKSTSSIFNLVRKSIIQTTIHCTKMHGPQVMASWSCGTNWPYESDTINNPILYQLQGSVHLKCPKMWDCQSIHGVFKKRPNFLNSAPTGTGSALRLLSTPSGRFWQQTAICLVSLWPLVAELSTCTSCSSDWWQSDNERAWRTTCVCVCEILLQTWQKFYRDISIA